MRGITKVQIAILIGLAAVVVATATIVSKPPESAAPVIPRDIPAEARARENPFAGVPEAIENGRLLFSSQCTMCHGKEGDGTGELVATLKLAVPDLTDPNLQKRRTDGELFYILSHGCGPSMTPQAERLKEEWRWYLVSYVRTLERHRSAPVT